MRWLARNRREAPPQSHPADRPLTVGVIGSPGVGKSALLQALSSKTFEIDEGRAREDQFYTTLLERPYVNGRLWTLYFSEISSDPNDEYRTYAYPSIDIFLVCFAAGDKQSYKDALHKYIPEIRLLRPDGAPVILVETKNDNYMADEDRAGTGELDWTWHAARLWKRTQTRMRMRRYTYKLTHPKLLLDKRVKPSRPMGDGTNPFDWLPDEILMLIISFLHTPDLARLAQTCRRMHRLTKDELVWPSRSRIHLFGGISLAGTHWCSAKTRFGVESLPYVIARAYDHFFYQETRPLISKSLSFEDPHEVIQQLRIS